MRTIILFFLLTFVQSALANYDDVIITGKVTKVSDKTIQLIITDVIRDRKIITSRIDNQGCFKFKYSQKYAHDNLLKYGQELYTIFVGPGDNLKIDINNKKILFSGDRKIINEEISRLMDKLPGFYSWRDVNNATKVLTPGAYKVEMMRLGKKFQDSLRVFNNRYKTSYEFRQWADYYLKYSVLDDLMRYRWLNPEGEKRKLPEGYFDFIQQSGLVIDNRFPAENVANKSDFDSHSLMCSYSNRFLNEYFNVLAKTTKPQSAGENEIKKNFQRFADVIVNQTGGETRELLLAKLFLMAVEKKAISVFETFLPIFNQYVKNEFVRSVVTEESDKIKRIINDRRIPDDAIFCNLSKDTILADLVDKIVAENRNKVIYIDLWSTWCSPCLGEMPYSKDLQDQFKDKPVSFVYLCAQSKEENWKSTIANLELSGQHYFLSRDQFNLLSDKFQINGVPHYILIDKNGIVADKDAQNPSSRIINERINSLLE